MKTRFPIQLMLDRSYGSYAYDQNTHERYLDMFNMWSSLPLGYDHFSLNEMSYTTSEIFSFKMCNNVFETEELEIFEEKFKKSLRMYSDFHYCCTGALAIESAIKSALTYNPGIVLGMENSFHGVNSWGTVTDRESHSKLRFKGYPKVRDLITLSTWGILQNLRYNSDSVSCVVIEPIQCTAGDIYPAVSELLGIQALCRKHDVCLIVDEIQTGFGTTGSWWYSGKIGLIPDILVFGKKAQVSGIATTDKYAGAMNSDEMKLSVTFDGDLIDMVRATYIMDAYEKFDLILHANENQETFKKNLSASFDNYRGCGNLIAFDLGGRVQRDTFVSKCFGRKLLVSPAAERTVRLRPNMAVTEEEIDECCSILLDCRN